MHYNMHLYALKKKKNDHIVHKIKLSLLNWEGKR
jgi:hypothetical protein